MEIRFSRNGTTGHLHARRELSEPPIRGGSWGSAEAAFWRRVRDTLIRAGIPAVRRLMTADRHMTREERHYVRAPGARQRWAWAAYDPDDAIRGVAEAFNAREEIRLLVAGTINVPPGDTSAAPAASATIRARAARLAEATQTAYSVDRYTPAGWRACARLLCELGLTDAEAEAVLLSKIMRWAGDNDTQRRYGQHNSRTLRVYLAALQRPGEASALPGLRRWLAGR